MTTSAPPDADALLEALDADQRAVAEQLTGPVCVLAGAGTGKTRAITYRIARGVSAGVYNPTSVLAVTFTARAAGQMRSRLRDLGVPGVQARTFHAAAMRQLSYFWPSAIGGSMPRIAAHKAPLIGEAAGRLGLSVDRLAIRDLAAEVEWAKVSMVTADDYPRLATRTGREGVAGFDATTVARLLSVYDEAKTERGVIDFEDVLLLMVGILTERGDVAETVRRQYRHFVVDEYQDVSPLQHRLLSLWLGDRSELCVVGDAAQTIYSFTGATSNYLTSFRNEYPQAPVIHLVRDYRSTPQVVSLANTVMRKAGKYRPAATVELKAQRPSGPAASFNAYPDDQEEARGVAQQARRLIDAGTSASEIAVLYRTNSQSESYEQALSEAGIGYLVRGGERFFSRKEVKDAMVLLRGAARSHANMPLPEAVRDVLTGAGWTEEPPASRGATRERWESLNALVQLADEMHATRQGRMSDLVAELTERAGAQHAPTVDGVTLASLHSAKGLEWDAVFLVGLSDGLLPISLAQGDEAVAEERRLLYVGITRAREHLHLSYSRARSAGGRGNRRHSRFLDGIWPPEDPRAGERSKSRQSKTSRAESLANTLTENDADPQVFERLRQWRAETAKKLDRPAFTILHDSTLVAIAAAQPTQLRQLALLRGLGPTKLDAYGPQILAVVRDDEAAPSTP